MDNCNYIETYVESCPRCGAAHDDMTFRAMRQPHHEMTHFASCPFTGDPILLRRDAGEPTTQAVLAFDVKRRVFLVDDEQQTMIAGYCVDDVFKLLYPYVNELDPHDEPLRLTIAVQSLTEEEVDALPEL